nr:AAA family ATPase [Rickettsia endosymbiont of Ceutorhynchus assimilis]
MQGNKLPRMIVGTDEFYDLVINSDVFVDKSLMIKELLEDSSKVVLITRPRRWGKSLNMNMLQKFFEIEIDEKGTVLSEGNKVNHKLFIGGEIDLAFASGRKKILQKLKIAEYEDIITDYQGQFPVVLLNLKDVKGSSYREFEEGVIYQIMTLFNNHRYLKDYYLTNNTNLLDEGQKSRLERYFVGKVDTADLKISLRFLSELLFKHFNQKVYILIDEYDTPINSAYIKLGNQKNLKKC